MYSDILNNFRITRFTHIIILKLETSFTQYIILTRESTTLERLKQPIYTHVKRRHDHHAWMSPPGSLTQPLSAHTTTRRRYMELIASELRA